VNLRKLVTEQSWKEVTLLLGTLVNVRGGASDLDLLTFQGRNRSCHFYLASFDKIGEAV
jgi:hypothetical protein